MKKIYLIFVLILMVLLSGCGSKKLSWKVYEHDKKFTTYNVVYPKDTNWSKNHELFKQAIDKKFDKFGVKRGDELEIRISISRFTEGNRALRYIIGFGAGAAKAAVKTDFYDKDKKIGELATRTTMARPLDIQAVYDYIANKIVKFSMKNFLLNPNKKDENK